MDNRRALSRINLFFKAELKLASGQQIKSSAGAINLKGVFFVGGISAKKNEKCQVNIWLNETVEIIAKGIVRRIAVDGVGIEFVELVSSNAFLQLKSIMENNADDQHSFLKELEDYSGTRKDDQ